jgi:putative transposase
MVRKRHSLSEISAKLLHSDTLAKAGKPQAEIAQALGISLMTYHRWRKARHESPSAKSSSSDRSMDIDSADRGDLVSRISLLHSENSRLRRLVTDLLLETDKLEEVLALPRPQNGTAVPEKSGQKQSPTARRIQRRRQELAFTAAKIR